MKIIILASIFAFSASALAKDYTCIAQLKRNQILKNIELVIPTPAEGLSSSFQIEDIKFSVFRDYGDTFRLEILKALPGNKFFLMSETIGAGDTIYSRVYLSDAETANVHCTTNWPH